MNTIIKTTRPGSAWPVTVNLPGVCLMRVKPGTAPAAANDPAPK